MGELSHFELGDGGNILAKKFVQAVKIAHNNPYRAVTHNKGIMNGIDALAIATEMILEPLKQGFMPMLLKMGSTEGFQKR